MLLSDMPSIQTTEIEVEKIMISGENKFGFRKVEVRITKRPVRVKFVSGIRNCFPIIGLIER